VGLKRGLLLQEWEHDGAADERGVDQSVALRATDVDAAGLATTAMLDPLPPPLNTDDVFDGEDRCVVQR
jgi:hypothetical protein